MGNHDIDITPILVTGQTAIATAHVSLKEFRNCRAKSFYISNVGLGRDPLAETGKFNQRGFGFQHLKVIGGVKHRTVKQKHPQRHVLGVVRFWGIAFAGLGGRKNLHTEPSGVGKDQFQPRLAAKVRNLVQIGNQRFRKLLRRAQEIGVQSLASACLIPFQSGNIKPFQGPLMALQ